MAVRWCYIDDCRKPATLVIESYPDDVTLCEDHAHIHHWCEESLNGPDPSQEGL